MTEITITLRVTPHQLSLIQGLTSHVEGRGTVYRDELHEATGAETDQDKQLIGRLLRLMGYSKPRWSRKHGSVYEPVTEAVAA